MIKITFLERITPEEYEVIEDKLQRLLTTEEIEADVENTETGKEFTTPTIKEEIGFH